MAEPAVAACPQMRSNATNALGRSCAVRNKKHSWRKYMRKVSRRKFLKLSGVGALGASSGIAAILKAGTAPGLCPRHDGALGAVAILCRPRTRCSSGIVADARRRSASSSTSRPSTPTTSRRASPRRSSPGRAPTSCWRSTTGRSSMPTASPTSATWPRNRQGTGRLLRHLEQCRQRRQELARGAVVHRRRACSPIANPGATRPATARRSFRKPGAISRGRQEAQGQGAPDRQIARPHLR